MSTSPVVQHDQPSIVACTISRDVQIFDLLIEDMEAALGDSWGDLSFEDAASFLSQPEANSLQFVTIAMDTEDEDNLAIISEVVSAAKAARIKVILIAEDVSPSALHQLLREGGDEFVPYPLPENELANAIERVLTAEEPEVPATGENKFKATGDRSGVVIPVHGLAGGVGATMLAVNLAWELANVEKEDPPKVCLIDLDFQFGSASTYLDLPRREAVLEMLTDTEAMDKDAFMQALLTYGDKLHVLTSPMDMIPLDMITPEDIGRVMEMARVNFDYVIVDMPSTMVEWSQTVLEMSHVYFAMIELDMRSAQNTLRLKRALQSEDLPFEKLRFVLNRAPGFTDLNGKSRVKRLSESLGISIEVLLPDGGKPVAQSADHGAPMAEQIPKNPLRKEITKLAKSVHDVNQSEATEARA
ncbi:AAA family ATPase [Yoonia sediminilitoris]|uniref:Pilus assembly protein CpaE n=1 Tax=Yoonia sediminilitoris TaxID=1286148 RepID=A0A2T6KK82_9RHOB|nr:AAA family ATPase [Yoonia sediminilitoris]PUB16319.1 pilus assembly protein CpaE [Yoonia sediminilitoris]RCW96668.1 pilus assembly protein CpaE [Yoonia sediminilitoris]